VRGTSVTRRIGVGAVLAALSVVGTAQAAAADPVPAPAVSLLAAYPTAPCDPDGPTAADASLATELNAALAADMRGYMTAYRTSCARMVVEAVKARGLSSRAAVIAITTVIVETHLQNVSEELDHDSLGLFQQRASWGSREQRLDPTWATNAFLNKMLQEYPNDSWKTAPIGEVCQAVQVSAYGDRYQLQAGDAQIIVNALWAGSPSGSPDDVSRDGVIVGTDGRISLYTVRADGDVWGRSQATVGGVFNSWQRLSTGGGFAGRVAVLRDDLNRVALYVRRDGTIYGASQAEAGGSFGTWKVIGTNGAGVTGDPRAVYGYQGRIAIYATTSSGNLSGVNQTSPGGGFGSWQQLTTGGGYTGKPTALVDVRQRVALYVRRNGTIYGASQSEAGGSFGAWGPMGTGGAGVASDPTAVYGVGGRVTIYVTNGSGDVSGVNQTSAGGAFGAWQVLTNTGGYTGKPTVLVDSYSRIAVYVRRNGTIYGASQPEAGGAFGTWAARGTGSPVITGDPTAVYGAGKRIAIYAASTDDTIGGVNQEEAGGAFGAWVLL